MPQPRAFRILVTRPRPEGEALCQTLQAAGYETVYLPTLEIKPLGDNPTLRAQLADLDQYTWAIFISRSAVRSSAAVIQARWPQLPPQLRFAAVGQGTADSLREAGFPEALYPRDTWTSEGLLALPEFQQLSQQRIALFCGEGGRPYLAESLQARGAAVTRFVTYQRLLPEQDLSGPKTLLAQGEIDALLSTSVESLNNLEKMFGPEAEESLKKIPLVLVSERIMILAKEKGFERCYLAQTASHEGLLQAFNSIRMRS